MIYLQIYAQQREDGMTRGSGMIRRYVVGIGLVMSVFLSASLMARQYAAIIIDAHSGEVVHQSNPDTHAHPASMTKMMTLYLVFKAIDAGKLKFNQPIKVSAHAAKQNPCKLWLKAGSTITVKQAVLGAVTLSANDASVVLAEAIAGSEIKFAELMTKEAKRLGMTRTVFKNASGLPHKLQITTARDMARLGQSLFKDFPHHFALFKEKSFVYKGKRHTNHNRLLERVPEIDGIKTGFINASGFNLTASMVKHGKRLIAVVMGGKSARSRDDHMLKLLNTSFDKIKKGKGSGGGATKTPGFSDMEQLLTSVSQDEMLIEASTKPKDKKAEAIQDAIAEIQEEETLDALLAKMEEEDLPQNSLAPLAQNNVKKVAAGKTVSLVSSKKTKASKSKIVKAKPKKPTVKEPSAKKAQKKAAPKKPTMKKKPAVKKKLAKKTPPQKKKKG